MLYHLAPPREISWCDLPGTTIAAAAEQGVDLALLSWEAAGERAFSDDLLRVALRHGHPSNTGIVLDADHAVDLGRAAELRLDQRTLDEAQQRLRERSGPLMERLLPGWADRTESRDGRLRDRTETIAREAEADLADVMGTPVDRRLVDLWTGLGGQLPD